MPWYVFALTDAAPSRGRNAGFQSPVVFRPVDGGFAAVERRADVPPVEFGALRTHQRIVERLATRVPAILPVRFGTLLSTDELEEALEGRREDLSDAFTLVRDRRQMTWRLKSPAPVKASTDDAGLSSGSGAEYLRRKSRQSVPPPSGAFRRVRDSVGSFVVAERHQPSTTALPETLYHLVERTQLEAYSGAAAHVQKESQMLTLSGPWAPYAFVPELF